MSTKSRNQGQERIRANAKQDTSKGAMWGVYSAFNHIKVADVNNIKDFCKSHNLGANAHIQIYRTNSVGENGKVSLFQYKGYFIRRNGDNSVPFPPLAERKPLRYAIYNAETQEKVIEIAAKDLGAWMKEQGFQAGRTATLARTFKTNDRGELLYPTYRGFFVRPVITELEMSEMTHDEIHAYNSIPMPVQKSKPNNDLWVVYNKHLDIVSITDDLSDYQVERTAENLHIPGIYATNRFIGVKPGEIKLTAAFSNGFCIRSYNDVVNGSGPTLPKPINCSGVDLDSDHDIIVWDESKRNGSLVHGSFVPSYQNTFRVHKLSKKKRAELLENAVNFATDYKLLTTSENTLGAVLVKDLGRHEVVAMLDALGVVLPPIQRVV